MRLVRTVLVGACVAAALAGSALAQTAPAPVARPAAEAPPAPASVARAWGRYAEATEVQLRDVAAYVRVAPEDRSDVAVAVVNSGPLRAPEFRISRRRLIIDGKLRHQIRSCRVRGAQGFEVVTSRQGRVAGGELPVIELRVPRQAVITANGAVRLHMAPAQSVRLRLDGCGDADIVRVEDAAEVSVSGAPDVRIYEAGSATVAVAGAGDITLGNIREGLTASIAGAGDLVAAHVDGPTSIAIQGAGDVTIRDGRATTLAIAIAGAGDVVHNGSAERLDAAILGAGDVRVRRVDGPVSRRVLGGGDVIVGR